MIHNIYSINPTKNHNLQQREKRLYGRKCISPLYWDEIGERQMLGPEIVQRTCEKIGIIRECLKATQSRQKTYADVGRRDLEFQVGDKVFLKVTLMKRIKRFGKKGKLSPKCVDSE